MYVANVRKATETSKRRPQVSICSRMGTALIWEDWITYSHLGQVGSFWTREEAGSEKGRNLSSKEIHAGFETDWGKQSQ